jgi:hypothetical protein
MFVTAYRSFSACVDCAGNDFDNKALNCLYSLSEKYNGTSYGSDVTLEKFKIAAKAIRNWESIRISATCAPLIEYPFEIQEAEPRSMTALSLTPIETDFISQGLVDIDNSTLTYARPNRSSLESWTGVVIKTNRCKIRYCAKRTEESSVVNGKLIAEEKDYPLNFTLWCGKDGSLCNHLQATLQTKDGALKFVLDTASLSTLGYWAPTMFSTLNKMSQITPSAPEAAKMLSTAINSFLMGPENANTSRVFGTAMMQETYILVRWQWAALPGMVVLLSITFLVLTIWESGRSEQLFKNSVLTGYFYRVRTISTLMELGKVSTALTAETGRQDGYDSLLRRGKDVEVRLERNNEGKLEFLEGR